MPYISDTQIARVQDQLVIARSAGNRFLAKAKEKAKENQLEATLYSTGGAVGMGYLRGKMEDKETGEWHIAKIPVDVELLTGVALLGAGYMGYLGKYTTEVANVANGILAHYSGQIARKYAKTGEFSSIAGSELSDALSSY